MNIAVFGSGYVGLVTATCLAEVGNFVTCVDVDEVRVRELRAGNVPIYEPGLEELLRSVLAAGQLQFSVDAKAAIEAAEVIFVAVGTPGTDAGHADLSQIDDVARSIGEFAIDDIIVVHKSTVPVGTAARVDQLIRGLLDRRGAGVKIAVVSNPEFLKEGAAVTDFKRPDRIVIGSDDPAAIEAMTRVYAPFSRNHEKVVVMDAPSAELTKYAANAMLATKISFMNEMAAIAEKVGADIEQVRLGIGADPRIGYSFIYPGAGFGGSCFPKDIRALRVTATSHGVEPEILDAVHNRNQNQKHLLSRKILAFFDGDLTGRRIAIWGLSFKPNTDDIREAPSRTLIDDLLSAGATISAHDPAAMAVVRPLYDESRLVLADDPYGALANADALVIVTEWKLYWNPDFGRVRELMRHPVVFDGRNVLDPAVAADAGLSYHPIGRSSVGPPTATALE